MTNLLDHLAIIFVKWRISKGWGGNCKTMDYEDSPDQPQNLMGTKKWQRCGSCQAKEVIEWLEQWRKL